MIGSSGYEYVHRARIYSPSPSVKRIICSYNTLPSISLLARNEHSSSTTNPSSPTQPTTLNELTPNPSSTQLSKRSHHPIDSVIGCKRIRSECASISSIQSTSESNGLLPSSSTCTYHQLNFTNPITRNNTPSDVPTLTVSLSPTYRHIWLELQRKSDLLRRQVMQKEMELRVPDVGSFQKMERTRRCNCSLWFRIVLLITTVYAGSLNVYEVNKITYDFDISNVPIGFDNIDLSSIHSIHISSLLSKLKETKKSDDESALIVTNENGQKFECELPIIKEVGNNDKSDESSSLTQNIVSDVLSAAFYVRNCLKKNFGWWTYELCFGKYIHQLHYEGTNVVDGPISLGNYSDDAEITETKSHLKSDQQLYFEQHYTNGSMCELIGKPRVTTVKFECDETLSTNEAYLDEVDEQSTCRYVVRVKVGSLCKLNAFKPSAASNSLQHHTAVLCRPLLEEHQAVTFVHSLINRHRHKMLVQKQIDDLIERITSLKRQLKLHKRSASVSPFTKNKYSKFNKKLTSQLDSLHKTLNKLTSEVEGVQFDKTIIIDDDEEDEFEVSEWDKDRESLYWYFKDIHFDRSFFPATIQYVRAKNVYYLKLSSYYKKLGEGFDDSSYPYARFISDVDSGRISELDLSIILGPLKEVFDEHLIPGVLPDHISVTRAVPLFENMYTSEETINGLIGAFQKSVISFLVQQLDNNNSIDSRDVISKCSRQLLKIRAVVCFNVYNDAVELVWRSKGIFDKTLMPLYSDRDIVDDSGLFSLVILLWTYIDIVIVIMMVLIEEVKIHLITTNDNMDWIDNRLNSLIDAFIDEQKWLNDEREKYSRMVDAYNFDVNMGSDGTNKRNVKEERDTNSGAVLPILRRVIV
ncbi:unnamed protein product [Anisakis simplex]|uniref:Protein OS-9 (inferred by orthology to a human protein) n=1 Tax=Anisakis simplex TaxID=6269 RepID=A0A0M3K8Q3_ANISI|nr:unnamed protein product [Anisakis simplex]